MRFYSLSFLASKMCYKYAFHTQFREGVVKIVAFTEPLIAPPAEPDKERHRPFEEPEYPTYVTVVMSLAPDSLLR